MRSIRFTWWKMRMLRRLHGLGLHWYMKNGPIPGYMCYFCGKWTPR